MDAKEWVVIADVGASRPATRTDSCGDMEQLESMDFIPVSEHDTKEAADQACVARRSSNDGWAYLVLSRRDYLAKTPTPGASTT